MTAHVFSTRTMHAIFAVASLIGLTAIGFGSARADPDPAVVDRVMTEAMQQWGQPGAALAIVQGAATYTKGYGTRNLATRAPVDPDTIFAIGSCSKAFASATVAKLVTDKRLHWDDRVDAHLKWFQTGDPHVDHDLRVRDVLTHRSGLRASILRPAASDRLSYLRSMRSAEPLHPLRYQYSYSNDAYTLIGQLVAEVSERSWADFARQELWQPLGMTRTNADHRVARSDANSAAPHMLFGDALRPVRWVYEDWTALPSGGVNSTASDLIPWLRFQLDEGAVGDRTLLAPATFEEMHGAQTPLRGALATQHLKFGDLVGRGSHGVQFDSYGMGWMLHSYRGHKVLYHGGRIPGFRCLVGMLPERNFGVAILLNSDRIALPFALFQSLVDIELGVPPRNWSAIFWKAEQEFAKGGEAQRAAIAAQRIGDAPPSRPLQEYTGTFTHESGEIALDLTLVRRILRARFGRIEYEAVPWHHDVFRLIPRRLSTPADGMVEWPYPTDDYSFVTFRIDEHGKVSRLDGALGQFRRASPPPPLE